MKHIIKHDRLGDVEIIQSARTKRLIISVRPPAVVRISMPYCVTISEAMRFLDQKIDWVECNLEKLKAKRIDKIITEPYFTRTRTLRLIPSENNKIFGRITPLHIEVTYPKQMDVSDERVQEVIRLSIERSWKLDAEAILPARINNIAELHNLSYNKLSIRNTISRWGSCSSNNNIQLSIHLMSLPDHLIDYIIRHELCHTIHKNHGAGFHEMLNRITNGKHKTLRAELKNYSTRW